MFIAKIFLSKQSKAQQQHFSKLECETCKQKIKISVINGGETIVEDRNELQKMFGWDQIIYSLQTKNTNIKIDINKKIIKEKTNRLHD